MHNTFFFIILQLYLELLTGQNRLLVLREMKYLSVFFAHSKINLCNQSSGPYSPVSEDCYVFLQCEKCWRRQLDSADLSDTALHTRAQQISRMLEGHAKDNYCSQRTNCSLFDLSFSEEVRVKWRLNNLPMVVSRAFQSVAEQDLEKVSTWQRRVACLIDLHAWGRRPGPGVGKKE